MRSPTLARSPYISLPLFVIYSKGNFCFKEELDVTE